MKNDTEPKEELLGEALDLARAYTEDPPPRDDVLLGLEPGNVGILGGQGGVSKSWWVLTLCHDLALGGFCEAVRTTLAPPIAQHVGFLTAEESVSDLRRRVHALGSYLSEDERAHAAEHVAIHSLKGEVPVLMDASGEIDDKVRDAIMRFSEGKRLIVLDPLMRIVRADKNDEGMMTTLVVALEQMSARSGAAIMFSHHSGKGAIFAGHGDSALAMRGTLALSDAGRWAAMLIRPSEKEAAKRVVDRNEYRKLAIDKSNHAGERDIWFRRRGDGTLVYDAAKTVEPAVAKALATVTAIEDARSAKAKPEAEDDDERLPTFEEYAEQVIHEA